MSPAPRMLRRAAGTAVMVLLLVTIVGASRLAIPQRPGPRRFANGRPDTTIVLQPSQLTVVGANTWTTYGWLFSTDTSGYRHILRVVNGIGGANRVSSGWTIVNNQQVVSTTDLNSTVDSLKRVVWPDTNGAVDQSIYGPAGSFVTVEVFRTPNPNYTIWGPQVFTEPNSGPVTQSYHFTVPSGAQAPYTIHVVNGNPDGTNRVTNGTVWVNGLTVFDQNSWGAGVATRDRDVALNLNPPPDNQVTVRIANPPGSKLTISFTATDVDGANINVAWPPQNYVTDSSKVRFAGWTTDETSGSTTVNAQTASPSPGPFADSVTFSADGRYDIHIVTANAAGYTSDSVRTVIRAQAPSLVVTQPASAITTTTNASVTLAANWYSIAAVTVTVNGDTVSSGTISGSFSTSYPLALGANAFNVRATDGAGHSSSVMRTVIYDPAGPGLPEPTAPPIASTQLDGFLNNTAFLYGPGGVQTGATTSAFQPEYAAVVRGRVVQATATNDTLPLAHVVVSVVGHPEYGQTESRASGNFDLAVNGGGMLTLDFARSGFEEVQRQVTVPYRDFVRVDDVALLGLSTRQTAFNLANHAAFVQGPRVDDGGSVHAPALLFKDGTVVSGTDGNGNPVTLGPFLYFRATEFTVGPQGLRRMPAPLPATSAYTHCMDLAIVDPNTPGLKNVTFSKPVAYYVENFLGFPVGTKIPAGSYSPGAGWKGEEDGHVIQVLSTTGGSASIDVTGDAVADTGAALTALGIDSTELQEIAQLYKPGQSLWRGRVTHLSFWDWNFPFWWPDGAVGPLGGWPFWIELLLGHCRECAGSTIEMENQTLREDIPIVGTPFALHYSSARTAGNRRPYNVRIPLKGSPGSLPASVNAILWFMDVAGSHFGGRFDATTGGVTSAPDHVDVAWNGLDEFGRTVTGMTTAHIKVGYGYTNVYGTDQRAGSVQTWGNPPSGTKSSITTSGNEGVIWSQYDLPVGTMRNDVAGLGGWSITPNHFYDLGGKGTLYRGDGTTEPGERSNPIDDVLMPLTDAILDLAYAPDGTLYFCQANGASLSTIFHRMADGSVSRVIGGGTQTGDGVSGTSVQLPGNVAFALGADGTIYFVEPATHRVRRWDPATSLVGTIANTAGVSGTGGDGGPALSAQLITPSAIAVGPDGTLYVIDSAIGAFSIRRIAPDGTISRFAGNGQSTGFTDLPIRADSTAINPFHGRIHVGPRGDVVFADQGLNRARRITPDGIMHLIGFFNAPCDVQYSPDGVLHVMTGNGSLVHTQVFRIESGQPAIAIAGTGTGPVADTWTAPSPALSVSMLAGDCMSFSREGQLALGLGSRVYVVRPAMPGFTLSQYLVASADASEQYVFDVTGRHLRTLDGLTGGTRYAFTYQSYSAGTALLRAIYDMNGDSTIIHRDGSGTPLDITTTDGAVTTLGLSGGMLSSVTNPTGTETVSLFANATTGLLDSLRDARGVSHQFTYESDGRLRRDLAGDGYSTSLAETSLPEDSLPDRAVHATSALGRVSADSVDFRDDRQTEIRYATGADNLTQTTTKNSDESVNVVSPDGTSFAYTPRPDPRYGMQAPFAGSLTLRRPSGVTGTINTTRTLSPFTEASFVNGRTYTTSYTSTSHTITVTPPMTGRVVSSTVDSVGRPLMIILPSPLAGIIAHYDTRGRMDTLRIGGRRWEYHYEDARGRLTRIVDPLNQTTQFSYDDADRLQSETLPGGADVVNFQHDAGGNLTGIQPPGRPFHQFAYTPGGLLREYDPPDVPGVSPDTTHYGNDADREVTTVDRPDNQSTSLLYDGSGRLQTIRQPRGDAVLTYYSAGNGAGQPATLSSPDGVQLTFGYDGSLPNGETWSFPGGSTGSVSYTYDGNQWPTLQRVTGTDNVASDLNYAFDNDGVATSAALTGGASLGLHSSNTTALLDSTRVSGLATRHAYNAFGEPTSFAAWYGADTLFASSYERDNLGRITRIVETIGGVTTDRAYGYDLRGRLTVVRDSLAHVVIGAYGYDGNGNRTSATDGGVTRSGTFDAQDRLTDLGTAHFTYTAAGERLTRTDPSGTDSTVYDLLGNLLRVKRATGAAVNYAVDGEGRRVARTVNGSVTQRWAYANDLAVVGELDSTGTLRKRFVYATRTNVPDAMIVRNASGPDSTYRLVTDHLGSVRLVVNASTGYVAERLDYDAWGVVTTDTNPGFQPFGYAGGLYDAATSVVRFGARDYDAIAGVWTSPDPVGFGSNSINLYSYVSGDPINYTDAFGTDALMRTLRTVGELIDGPFFAKTKAEQEVRTKRLEGPYANAYRHARASQLMSCHYGRVVALGAGAAQEVISYVHFCAALAQRPPRTKEDLLHQTYDYVDDTIVDLRNDWSGSTGADPGNLLREGRLYGPDQRPLPSVRGF